jgi:hypothetical protein
MKVIRILLFLVLGLAALILLMGLFAKKKYHVERSIEINAPRSIVHEQVRYFRNFPNWSPWQEYDPNMKTSIEGTDGQPGAVYKWAGNKDVGTGQQTLKSVTPERVDMEVKFTEPWEAVSPSFMKLEEKDGKTFATWGFDMNIGFPWNGLAMFTNVDEGVGKDYERGLLNLKRVSEEMANKKYRGYSVKEADIPVKYYVGVRKTVPFQQLPIFFSTNLPKIMQAVTDGGGQMAGAPSELIWSFDQNAGQADIAAAIPVAQEMQLKGWTTFPVGGRKALVVDYLGNYAKIGDAHYAVEDYMTARGYRSMPPAVQEYMTDPMTEPDTSKWLTRVIYFVQPKD